MFRNCPFNDVAGCFPGKKNALICKTERQHYDKRNSLNLTHFILRSEKVIFDKLEIFVQSLESLPSYICFSEMILENNSRGKNDRFDVLTSSSGN